MLSRGGAWTTLLYHLASLKAARVNLPLAHLLREAHSVTADLLPVALGPYARASATVARLVAALPRSMGGLRIPLCALEVSMLDDAAACLRLLDQDKSSTKPLSMQFLRTDINVYNAPPCGHAASRSFGRR